MKQVINEIGGVKLGEVAIIVADGGKSHFKCPVCSEPSMQGCRCLRSDQECKNGHKWHKCGVHHTTVVGDSDHTLPITVCTCTFANIQVTDNKPVDNDYYMTINGEKEPMEDAMVEYLLKEGVLFVNSRKVVDEWGGKQEIGEETLVLYVLCNDTFAWASADAESISMKELPNLFDLVYEDNIFGSTKWVCKKRNQQPQSCIRELMIKKGAWTEDMDKLPENSYDKKRKK